MALRSPSYTQPSVPVTDAAEVTIYAGLGPVVYIGESPGASGYPRAWLFRGTMPGSQQQQVAPTTIYRVPGTFNPGDAVGTIELVPAGGDTSSFNVVDLPE